MDWITENIAIGNFIDAQNASTVKLDAILCLKPECCDEYNEDFAVLCLPLIDGSGNETRDFDDAVDFIDDAVSNDERVLVHCHAGRSRSICIVARYFMIKHEMTSHEALERIKTKREIYLSTGIEEILEI
jgi:atypical dual specificity phosphatase